MKSIKQGFCVLLLTVGLSAMAQDRINAPRREVKVTVDFGMDVMSNADYEFRYDGKTVEQGSTHDAMRMRLSVMTPIVSTRNFSLMSTVMYSFHNLDFVPNGVADNVFPIDMGRDHHLWGVRLGGAYRGRVMGRGVVAYGHATADFSNYGFEKVTGFAVGTVALRQSDSNYLGVGLVGFINTVSAWPIFPMLVWYHKFESGWIIDFMPPSVHVRYQLPVNYGRVSAGATVGYEKYYVRPANEHLPYQCLYNRSFLTPEIVYDRSLGQSLMLTVRAGMSVQLNGHLYSQQGHKRYVKIAHNPTAFLSLALSYKVY